MTLTADRFEEAMDAARGLVLAGSSAVAYVVPVALAGGYAVTDAQPATGGYVAITAAPAPFVGTIRRGGMDVWTV